MLKGFGLALALALLGAGAAAAQTLDPSGVYRPEMKFAVLFGRPMAIDGGANKDPTLGDIAKARGGASDDLLARQALDGLLASVKAASDCQSLMALKWPWMKPTSAAIVPADKTAGAYCKFLGVIDKEITFEVDLPLAGWNGKFLMGGGGGFIGNLQSGVKVAGLHRGYATAATDTGHPIPKDGGGSWAYRDPLRLVNFGHRGAHLAQANAKLVVQAFYKKPISRAYFVGGSGSGRMAMMEAERYPADFDGIVAACPATNWTQLNVIETSWTQQHMFATADDELKTYNPVLPGSKVPLLDAAVYAKCDALDGLKDGQITNPLACKFDPMKDLPLCKDGQDRPDCFTARQASVIAQIHDGPSNAAGQIMPGFAYGGEGVPGMWIPAPGAANAYVVGAAPKPGADNPYASRHYLLTNETLKYLIFNDPSYDLHSFNFDTDLPELQEAADVVDAQNPDLSAFRKRGGKLIMSVGWSDYAVGALVVKGFYDDMVTANGGLASTAQFARLFMLPGVGHCFAFDPARKTPHIVDLLTPLEDWVEKGKAPDNVIASHTVAGSGRDPPEDMPIDAPVDRRRPICAYPAVAVYDGKGDIDKAESFSCKAA